MYISIPCSLLCFSLQYQAFRYLYLCLYIYVHRRCKTCYVCDTSPFVFYGFNGQFNAFLFTLSLTSKTLPIVLRAFFGNSSIDIFLLRYLSPEIFSALTSFLSLFLSCTCVLTVDNFLFYLNASFTPSSDLSQEDTLSLTH